MGGGGNDELFTEETPITIREISGVGEITPPRRVQWSGENVILDTVDPLSQPVATKPLNGFSDNVEGEWDFDATVFFPAFAATSLKLQSVMSIHYGI